MIKERELNLLIDLTKLMRKYGPDSFIELSNIFSSDGKMQDISKILKNISINPQNSDVSQKTRSTTKSKKTTTPRNKYKKKKNAIEHEDKETNSYDEDRSLDAWSNIILDDKKKRTDI